MLKRSLERGQSLVFFGLVFVFVIVPFMALAIDLPSLWMRRRELQKFADEACLAGAIANQNADDVDGDRDFDAHDIRAAVIRSLNENGVEPSLYTPQEGSGTDLGKGILTSYSRIRVALWGPTLSWWSHLIPNRDGWEIGARAHCMEGLGGVLPLALKEWEGPGSRILETSRPNDEWSGPCPRRLPDPESDVSTRNPPYCWVWGDMQVLAGDGHVVNEGTGNSMNGLIGPDVRCEDFAGPPSDEGCDSKVYIPPAPDGAQSNTLKDLTQEYIAGGGYNGPLPWPGTYTGEHSALIAQQEGVSNNFLAQEVGERYNIGDHLLVFVYRDGELYDGNSNYDYVEVIGYTVVRLDYIDANTVAVRPVFPFENNGDLSIADDLPTTLEEVREAGFEIYPILLPWD